MSDPPFSVDPLNLPITPSSYVSDIEDNFAIIEDEIKDLDSRLKSATGSGTFDPFLEQGQLEVNGTFRLHRRMQEVSRTHVIPPDANVIPSTDYLVVDDGTGLGLAGGGVYTYHPTVCPGWYAPRDILPALTGPAVNAFGDEPASGGFGMQLDFPAGPRLNGTNDESVIFQPLSVHNPPERWAGRQLRAQIQYEHDAAVGSEPEIYAAWDVGGVRTVSQPAFTVAGALLPRTGLGTTNTVTFDFTPPAGARMLEIGIRIQDAAAHSFVFRRFIVSTNLQRSIDLAHPGHVATEQLLIDSHYFRSVHGIDGVDFVPTGPVILAGTTYGKTWMCDDRRPVIAPAQAVALGQWDAPNAAVYAKPLLVTQLAPFSGVLLAYITDGVTVVINEKLLNQGTGTYANYDDWKSLYSLDAALIIAAVPLGKDFNPDLLLEYDGEWLTTFRPLLLP